MPDKRKQTTLSFTANKKTRTDADGTTSEETSNVSINVTESTPAQSPVPPVSDTLKELRLVTKKMARDTLQQLVNGYTVRNSTAIQPATTNSKGCVLVQKVANRDENGYIQIPPVGFLDIHRTGKKTRMQNAHRLVIIAYKSEEEIRRLLWDLEQASHICHEPRCIKEEHLCVEPKNQNEDRKGCKGRVEVWAIINGVKYVFKAKACPHNPPCLADVEERVAEIA